MGKVQYQFGAELSIRGKPGTEFCIFGHQMTQGIEENAECESVYDLLHDECLNVSGYIITAR